MYVYMYYQPKPIAESVLFDQTCSKYAQDFFMYIKRPDVRVIVFSLNILHEPWRMSYTGAVPGQLMQKELVSLFI